MEFELNKVTKRLTEHGVRIELTQESKDFLIDKGTNTDFGARPLRRAIEQFVEDPLSEEILRGSFKGKDIIRVTVKTEDGGDKHLYFEALHQRRGQRRKAPRRSLFGCDLSRRPTSNF